MERIVAEITAGGGTVRIGVALDGGQGPSTDVHGAQRVQGGGYKQQEGSERRPGRPSREVITRQAIRRGTFTSVKDLIAAIETFIDGWNERCQPIVWTETADEILTKATGGQRSSFTRH